MQKLLFLAFTVLLLVSIGCATLWQKRQSNWGEIRAGQTRAEVVSLMGAPEAFDVEGRSETLRWSLNSFTVSAVHLSPEGIVESKEYKVDQGAERQEALRQQDQAARQQEVARAYIEAQSRQQPTRTTCTTKTILGTAYTDCQNH